MNSDDQDWEPPSEADMKLIAARRERSDQISKLMSGYLLKGYKMLGSVCPKCDTILLQTRQGTNYCVACSELDSDTDKDNPAINESAAISMARELEMASAAASVSPSDAHPASRVGGSLLDSDGGVSSLPVPSTSPHCTVGQTRADTKSKGCREDTNPNLSISSIDVQSFTTSIVTSGRDDANTRHKATTTASVSDGNDSGFYSSRIGNKKLSSVGVGGGDASSSLTSSVHVSRLHDKINWATQELDNTHSVEYSIHLCQLIKEASQAVVALRKANM